MDPHDDLVVGEDNDFGGAEVFAILGQQYAIYLPDGSNDDNNGDAPTLDLSDYDGEFFTLRWYNPRTGEFVGEDITLSGGELASLGFTPDGFQNTNDWAALVTLVPEPSSLAFMGLGAFVLMQRRQEHV